MPLERDSVATMNQAISTTAPSLAPFSTYSINPSLMLTTCTASTLCMLPMVIIAAIAGPSQSDLYALLGVAPATVIVMAYVLSAKRNLLLALSVFCGSGAVGAFGPGLLLYYVLRIQFDKVIWQLWMALGFGCALAGWFLTYSSLKFLARYSDWIAFKLFTRYIPGIDDKDTNHETDRLPTHPRGRR